MKIPGMRAWVFSIKAFIAASLALYIAMWIDLPRPYWAMATVYVVAQPFAGPTLSKAMYRLCGTVLGGIGAVLLVPNLSTSPELLTLGMALWCGACLFLSLRDRRPHSYIFVLAGYTAAIVGFPSVDDPGAIFTTAVARVEEIGLGIICAGVVGCLVFPHAIGGVFAERVRIWLGHAGTWAQEVLDQPSGIAQDMIRAELAADAIEIDMLATHLSFDPASPHGARRWAEMLRSRMLLLLALTSSIASRLHALPPDGLTAADRDALDALRGWLRNGAPEDEAAALRRAIDAAAPPLGQGAGWVDLLRANLMVRLREMVDLHVDCARLRRHILGAPGRPALTLPDIDGARGAGARHADTGLAIRSGVAAALAIGLGSAFWIATAWPDGSSLPVMAAVVCSFFAPADNPVRPQLGFAKWSSVAVIIGGAYVFAFMPLTHEFETLILMLAPVFLLAGVVAAEPKNAIIGLAIAANLPALLALQTRYSGDFASFANGGLSLIGGMWCGALVTAMMRVVRPHWVVRRLLRASWLSVARAAAQRGRGDRAIFASLMLDRAGQLASRLAVGESCQPVMAAIRIGLNVVDLRRARHALPHPTQARLDSVLDGLAAECRRRAGHRRDAAGRLTLATLDHALTDAASLPPGNGRNDLLLGLVGIRLSLFPDAAGTTPSLMNPILELAA